MTEYQMEIFYKEYLGGKSRAHALRDAQMQTLQFLEKGLGASQDTSTIKPKIRPNPRYWGAFQLVGEN
jgi:CHAT domain-containing protein